MMALAKARQRWRVDDMPLGTQGRGHILPDPAPHSAAMYKHICRHSKSSRNRTTASTWPIASYGGSARKCFKSVNCLVRRRSEERRVGKECGIMCRSGWGRDHVKKKRNKVREQRN